MEAQTTTTPVVQEGKLRWTVAHYERMFETGILTETDRVELLNGKITPMSPIGRFHAAVVTKLTRLYTPRLLQNYICRAEQPIRLANNSMPEPDFVVASFREDCYAAGHPTVADIHLLIEVADRTLLRDKTDKLKIYAAAGIPEYWILDINNRRLEVHREPQADGTYATLRTHREDARFEHILVGEVRVNELLPF